VDFRVGCGKFTTVKRLYTSILLSLGLSASPLVGEEEADWLKVEETPKSSRVGHELGISHGYTAGGDMDQGEREVGDVSSQNTKATYVATIPLGDGISFRTGIDYNRYSFSLPDATLMPNTLQSVAWTVGADFELSENWLMRVEVAPGLYSDFRDISGSDFNAPLILGFSYLVDSKLQVFFGIAIDPLFSTRFSSILDSPAFPGIGVRWQFADDWTLMALLPNPEIQYDLNDQVQLFAGGRLKGGSYRVSETQGDFTGRQDFNNDIITYQEVRAGLGARYRFHPAVSLEAEVGYTINRSFKYKNEDGLTYDGGSAPYAEIGLKGRF
jgi:opacity protein-like surface antigen